MMGLITTEQRRAHKAALQLAWRARNPDYMKRYHKQYYQKLLAENPAYYVEERERDPGRILLNNARHRAKRRGMEFSITKADIIIPATCPILGIPLFYSRGKASANSPSLDRVDNSRGYVPGNVKVISWAANKLKKDMPIETIYRLWQYVNSAASPKGEA